MLFHNRREAGAVLAQRLLHLKDKTNVIVLALPRGGVPVGYEIAQQLHAPLDIFLVRKLGVPGHEELAMGAIASGGVRVLNEDIVRHLHIPEEAIAAVAAQEQRELERREKIYREGRPFQNVKGQTVILVDDGLATGATMRAAAEALRQQQAGKILIAVPVASRATCEEFLGIVDEIICASTPEPFYGVGQWYYDFSQTTDEEVMELLAASREALKEV